MYPRDSASITYHLILHNSTNVFCDTLHNPDILHIAHQPLAGKAAAGHNLTGTGRVSAEPGKSGYSSTKVDAALVDSGPSDPAADGQGCQS